LVLRDLTVSKHCFASSMNSTCEDDWFVGGVWQGVGGHGVAEVVVSINSDGDGLPSRV